MLEHKIELITNFSYPVFKDAVVETIVFVVKNANPANHFVQVVDFDNRKMSTVLHEIEQQVFSKTHNNSFLVTASADDLEFKQKLDQVGKSLKSFAEINQAIALKHDRSKSLFTVRKASNYKPVLDGRNINRYTLSWDGNYLAYDVKNIHSCKRTDIFESKEKIFFRRVGDRLIATYDDQQHYALNTLVVISIKTNIGFVPKYLLGLINSKLLNFYYTKYLKSTKKVFSEIQARQLAQLPIRQVDFSNPDDKARHNKMVSLVERMLELHKQSAAVRSPLDKERVGREIESTDKQIDRLVYELYGLSPEESAIVEGKEQ
jgi:adenine-specific DNA-methyltransferase